MKKSVNKRFLGSKKDRKVLVIALGGNAILQPGQDGTKAEQLKNLEKTCGFIAEIVKSGKYLVVTHGNGPQVGNILLQNEAAKDRAAQMPMDVCGAESQGMLGYMIANSLEGELENSGYR